MLISGDFFIICLFLNFMTNFSIKISSVPMSLQENPELTEDEKH